MSSVLPLFSFIVVYAAARKTKGKGKEENYARNWAAPILYMPVLHSPPAPAIPFHSLLSRNNLPVISRDSYKCHVAIATIVVILNLVRYHPKGCHLLLSLLSLLFLLCYYSLSLHTLLCHQNMMIS